MYERNKIKSDNKKNLDNPDKSIKYQIYDGKTKEK